MSNPAPPPTSPALQPRRRLGVRRGNEFVRYRRILQICTLVFATSLIVWFLASVAHTLFAKPEVRPDALFSGDPRDIEGILRCQSRVRNLFSELEKVHFGPLLPKNELAAGVAWESLSQAWRKQWNQTGVDCRFSELVDRGVGPAYDRLAHVHEELDDIERIYSELLARFYMRTSVNGSDIRRALESSAAELEQKQKAARAVPKPVEGK